MATPLSQPGAIISNGVAKLTAAAPAASTAPDLQAIGIQGLLSALNNPGTMVGGHAGYTISNAPARAAEQAAYNTAISNNNKVYDQAVSEIAARNPGIQSGYDAGTAAIQAAARQQAIANQNLQNQQASNYAQAAANLGLGGVALPTGERLAAVTAANNQKLNANADAWQGFNSGAAQRAVAANNRTADAVRYQKGQQATSLSALMQKVMSTLVDKHVAGSAGKLVGAPTVSQLLSGYGKLLSTGTANNSQTLANNKFLASQKQQQVANAFKSAAAASKGQILPKSLLLKG